MVGVSTFCNRPPALRDRESRRRVYVEHRKTGIPQTRSRLGGRFPGPGESGGKDLARLGIPAWASGPSTVAEVLQDIEALSKVLGVEKKGEELAAGLEEDLEAVRLRSPKALPDPRCSLPSTAALDLRRRVLHRRRHNRGRQGQHRRRRRPAVPAAPAWRTSWRRTPMSSSWPFQKTKQRPSPGGPDGLRSGP